jgi:hypothetical protein
MELYRDKKKSNILLLIYAGIIVVLIAIFLYSIGLFDDHISVKLATITGVFVVILAIVIISKSLSMLETSPIVIFNDEGIISKTTAVSKAAGLILWKDIIGINLDKVGADILITLTVDKPQHYLPLIKKKLSGMIANGLADHNGNLLISLTASELEIDAQELITAILSFKEKINPLNINNTGI